MKPGIAFFDFDGTITTKDTLLEFIKFSKGSLSFYSGFAANAPSLLAFKAGLISNQVAKEKILSHFYRNTLIDDFETWCRHFSETSLPSLIRPAATNEIKKLQDAGIETVIVSASPHQWITGWAREMHMQVIATELEIINSKLTGKIKGLNCYGAEKVNRIRNQFQLEQYETVFAYGDSSGDEPMLQLAHHPFRKPFR